MKEDVSLMVEVGSRPHRLSLLPSYGPHPHARLLESLESQRGKINKQKRQGTCPTSFSAAATATTASFSRGGRSLSSLSYLSSLSQVYDKKWRVLFACLYVFSDSEYHHISLSFLPRFLFLLLSMTALFGFV